MVDHFSLRYLILPGLGWDHEPSRQKKTHVFFTEKRWRIKTYQITNLVQKCTKYIFRAWFCFLNFTTLFHGDHNISRCKDSYEPTSTLKCQFWRLLKWLQIWKSCDRHISGWWGCVREANIVDTCEIPFLVQLAFFYVLDPAGFVTLKNHCVWVICGYVQQPNKSKIMLLLLLLLLLPIPTKVSICTFKFVIFKSKVRMWVDSDVLATDSFLTMGTWHILV